MIHDADAIILPQGCSRNLYRLCRDSGAFLFPSYDMRFRHPGKIGQSRLFRRLGLPHPETLCWKDVAAYRGAFPGADTYPHGLPFLLKEDLSHEAEGVFLVEGASSLATALHRLAAREKSGMPGFVTQRLVPAGGNALRVVVIGEETVSYWKRPAVPGQIITTISRNAAIDHTWRPELQEKGRRLAGILMQKTGINLAAVDFVFPLSDTDPGPLFLEVNYFFGRRGLGGIERYYRLLHRAVRHWLIRKGLDPDRIALA